MSDTDLTPQSGPAAAGLDVPTASLSSPSWQEQDGVLRDMWLQNKTPQEISAVLNRSVAAVMTRAARLGLPRRAAPGRKPGSRRALNAEGSVARAPQARHTVRAPDGTPAPQVSTRICLMCLRPFQSQGRHNRICSSCKSSSEYESAVSIPDIHIPL